TNTIAPTTSGIQPQSPSSSPLPPRYTTSLAAAPTVTCAPLMTASATRSASCSAGSLARLTVRPDIATLGARCSVIAAGAVAAVAAERVGARVDGGGRRGGLGARVHADVAEVVAQALLEQQAHRGGQRAAAAPRGGGDELGRLAAAGRAASGAPMDRGCLVGP